MTVWEVSEGQTVLDPKEDGCTARLIVVEKGVLHAQGEPNRTGEGELYTAGRCVHWFDQGGCNSKQ